MSKVVHALLVFLFFLSFVLLSIGACDGKKKVALLSTREENDMFWGKLYRFAKVAADSFDIELIHLVAHDNHLNMVNNVKKAIAMKVDAIMLPNFKRQLPNCVKITKDANIPYFVFNSGFLGEDNPGDPDGKTWIGEMLPDDEFAGYLLTKELAGKAKNGNNGKVNIFAIQGYYADWGSIERTKGLYRYIAQNKEKLELIREPIPANWERKRARYISKRIFERYKDINMIWTASDGMAAGVRETLEDLKRTDIVTGGVDWADEGIDGIKSGKIQATVGGHYMEGAWVVVILSDYFSGIPLSRNELRMKSQMYALTKENIEIYLSNLSESNWPKINFKKFSKKYNPEIKTYNFSIKHFITDRSD